MIDHSDKKLDYALRAIQHPQLRETDEFLQWIGIPENKELFLELKACKEAVIRENLQRKRKYRKKMRILAIASSAAAVLILAFLIPSLLPSTSLPAEQPIRFFAANNNDEHVVLQMDGRSEQQLLTDSVMDVKDWKTVSADTVCCQTLTTPRGKDFLLVLADGTRLIYYDIAALNKYDLGVIGFKTFQIKVADIPEANVTSDTYNVYWVRTFKSVAEMENFAEAEVAAGK